MTIADGWRCPVCKVVWCPTFDNCPECSPTACEAEEHRQADRTVNGWTPDMREDWRRKEAERIAKQIERGVPPGPAQPPRVPWDVEVA